MIKSLLNQTLLILFFGFISISQKTSSMFGISLKRLSSFLLWNVKYEDEEKWIINKPNWIPSQRLKPSL